MTWCFCGQKVCGQRFTRQYLRAKFAGKGSRVKVREKIIAGKDSLAGKASQEMFAGKDLPKIPVRAKLAGKASQEKFAGKDLPKIPMRAKLAGKASRAKLSQPFARCITGYCCSVCKPEYHMALAMGLHWRLGEASPVAWLTEDLLLMIIERMKPRRQLPAWMSCSWNVTMQQRPRARATGTRATEHPSQTAQEKQCNCLRALVT